jgi:hypothetical protein
MAHGGFAATGDENGLRRAVFGILRNEGVGSLLEKAPVAGEEDVERGWAVNYALR